MAQGPVESRTVMVFRKRTERRANERDARKIAAQREKLFAMSDGGSAAHPLRVDSASLVEPRALATRCPRCEGALTLVEHNAVALDGALLRAAKMKCSQCASPWTIWFRIERPLAN